MERIASEAGGWVVAVIVVPEWPHPMATIAEPQAAYLSRAC